MRKILSALRRAANEFDMIADGDKIVVGMSGGKDSILLLAALHAYKKFSPQKFELFAVHIDTGFKDVNTVQMQALTDYCASINVPLDIVHTEIKQVVFDTRQESNPCSLCAKMRRGTLNTRANELGANKLALGHNADDLVETMLMSLVYEGRFSTFAPVSYLSRANVTMIRPLIYLDEVDILCAVKRLNLPVLTSPCPVNEKTQREWAKDVIKNLCKDVPFAKERMLGAIYHPERNNLWQANACLNVGDTNEKQNAGDFVSLNPVGTNAQQSAGIDPLNVGDKDTH